jgi:hypothetical protein
MRRMTALRDIRHTAPQARTFRARLADVPFAGALAT